MRKALVVALLLVGSAALGATVLREPLAQAASPFTNVIVGNTSTNPVPVAEQNLDGNGNVKVHEQGTASVNVTNSSVPVSAAQSGPWSVSLDGTPAVASADTTRKVAQFAADLDGDSNHTVFFGDVSWAKTVTVLTFCGAGSACGNVKVRVDVEVGGSRVYTLEEFSLANSQSTSPVHVYEDPGEQMFVSLLNENSGTAGNVAVAVLGRSN